MWELENSIRRLRATTATPGRKPVFKHDENIGAYVLKEGKVELIGIGIKRLF
jgi:hypothetical protein